MANARVRVMCSVKEWMKGLIKVISGGLVIMKEGKRVSRGSRPVG